MTITVNIHISEAEVVREHQIIVDDSALADVRYKFNPSGLAVVEIAKVLAAAFITHAIAGKYRQEYIPEAGREFAEARTLAQTAAMWCVAGDTKGL